MADVPVKKEVTIESALWRRTSYLKIMALEPEAQEYNLHTQTL